MRVDSLTHITSDGQWYGTNHDADLNRLLSEMDQARLDKAVLVGMPDLDCDHAILAACEDHPEKFIPVAGVDVSQDEMTVNERLLSISEAGFSGIKIHPRSSATPLTYPMVDFAVKRAGELNLASFICTIHRPPLPPQTQPLASSIQELCQNNPDSKIVLLHGGYTDLLATSELIRPLENAFLDLSFTFQRFQKTSLALDVDFLIDTFDRRIVFGSDFPEYTYSDVLDALKARGHSLDELDTAGVLGTNLVRFLEDG